MKASDYIADELERQGVRVVFEMIGGMITHLVDSIHQRGGIRIVSMHHEQGAGFAAEAVGRMTGAPGVALATSGPGATNLVTAIGSCYFDSVPAVFITGQVNTHELAGDRPIRQQGFQETDIVSIVKPVTKAAWQIAAAEEIPERLARAFALAREGRPGPVLLDIPMNLQRGEVEPPGAAFPAAASVEGGDVAAFARRAAAALRAASRPLVLAGGGLRSAGLADDFAAFAERAGIPAALTLMGLDLLPRDHPARVGMIGTYGNRWANQALMESDCLLVLGARLDVRQTGADAEGFKGARPIFHVDCDAGQLNNRVQGCDACAAELSEALPALAAELGPMEGLGPWREWIGERRARRPDTEELGDCAGINPNAFLRELGDASAAAAALVADVGKNQMWAAQSMPVHAGQRMLMSGGMGSMGFALPAAIGSVCASGRPAVCVMGDGGAQCNIQELETIASRGLPVKMVVLNNHCLGMVGQFQEDYFEGRMQSTVWGYSAPDFEAVARAYGLAARTIDSEAEIPAAIEWLWSDPAAPALLNVAVGQDTKLYPKAAYGRPINDMDPRVD